MVFIQEIVLPKIKVGAYVINLDEYKSIGTHWIALYVNGNNKKVCCDAIYFDSFGVEHITKVIKKFIGNKNIITNNYRIQTYDSKSLLDYINLFSPNDYEKNDKIILKYFQ